MHPVGFEPTISVSEWPHTYALDRATTGTCPTRFNVQKFCILPTVYLLAFSYGLQNKQRLFLYTVLTYRFL